MKKLCLVLFMLVLNNMAFAQESPTHGWELVSPDPISSFGERGTWNSTYNEPGAIIFHEGQYHLFVNGYTGAVQNNGVGYRVSDDGITYNWVSTTPILESANLPNAPLAISATAVLVQPDGTWVLYYQNFNSLNWPRIEATIGRATASNPAGPWIADENPVLTGTAGTWDAESVAYASVIPYEDGYVMYYVGSDTEGVERIGRATSADGITWEKDTNPVFELDAEQGEQAYFVVNQVIYSEGRWIMAYKNARHTVGLAYSSDGITWERDANNPILQSQDIEGASGLGFISFLAEGEGMYQLVVEANIGSRTQVYALRGLLTE